MSSPFNGSALTIPLGAVVADRRFPGETFFVDSHGRGEYGCTERRINGLQHYALQRDLIELCRCSQVSDGHNGWRCDPPHNIGGRP